MMKDERTRLTADLPKRKKGETDRTIKDRGPPTRDVLATDDAVAHHRGTIFRMIALNARFDGKVIVPETPLALPANQRLRVQVETIAEPIAPTTKRVLGGQPDAFLSIAPDFDAELGDDFWLGEEK